MVFNIIVKYTCKIQIVVHIKVEKTPKHKKKQKKLGSSTKTSSKLPLYSLIKLERDLEG